MKWIVKKHAGLWVRRCPYCNHITKHAAQPSDNFICQCKAIVNPETYQLLQNCARKLSMGLK